MGTNVWVLFLSRILDGISAAFIMSGVMAFMADITTNDERPKSMGYISAAISAQSNFLKEIQKSFKPVYLIAFVIVFVLAFGLSAYETVFSLFTDHKFGFLPRDIAAILTVSSIFTRYINSTTTFIYEQNSLQNSLYTRSIAQVDLNNL